MHSCALQMRYRILAVEKEGGEIKQKLHRLYETEKHFKLSVRFLLMIIKTQRSE